MDGTTSREGGGPCAGGGNGESWRGSMGVSMKEVFDNWCKEGGNKRGRETSDEDGDVVKVFKNDNLRSDVVGWFEARSIME